MLCACAMAAQAGAITVQDFAGREVTLTKPAQRIVALAPHIVENLYSAGAGERLVGVVSYSNYPQQAARIPQVGSYNAFSLEQIVALHPDLVVMWGSGNGMQALDRLQELDIPVYVSELRQLSDVPHSIRRLGQLAGTIAASEREARRIEEEMAILVITTQFIGRACRRQLRHSLIKFLLQIGHLVCSIVLCRERCRGENSIVPTCR